MFRSFERKLKLKFFAVLLALTAAIFGANGKAYAGERFEYTISDFDTPLVIDASQSKAEINTTLHRITLPKKGLPNALSFAPDGSLEYMVLTTDGVKHYSFDGLQMVENPFLSVSGVQDPVGLACAHPYPDMWVAEEDRVVRYSFSGDALLENPALSVAGLTGVVSIAAGEEGGLAVLADGGVKRYLSSGSAMLEVPALEPDLGSGASPVALALGSGYDIAVLEQDRIRYYSFTGSQLVENPFLSVSGLSAARSFAVDAETCTFTVLDENQVKRYVLSGSTMQYSAALSVTGGLISPVAVAARPGTYDIAVIDGNQVRYFGWNGSRMVEIPDLAVTVANIARSDRYWNTGVVVSQFLGTVDPVNHVRVRAYHELPPGTSVTWSVSADGGANWTVRWRVRGVEGGTVAEVTDDSGSTWWEMGTAEDATPDVNNPELWAEVQPGQEICFKAEMETADDTVTPVIKDLVVLEAGNKPVVTMDPVPGWFYVTTPTFTWDYSDPDGDEQSGFQLVIRRLADGAVVYDSGFVESSEKSFTLPTSSDPSVPGPLWASGAYEFTVEIRAMDASGIPSDWTPPQTFRVLAFERPRIAEIVSAPAGQPVPDPDDPATHIMILPGMTKEQLPKVKAGSKVVMILDSVGPVITPARDIFRFPYLSTEAVVEEASSEYDPGSPVNRWAVSFYTEASIEQVPSGTVVELHALANGAVGGWTEFGTTGGTTTNGMLDYAEGVVVTEGTVYEDWQVILQGRD